MNFHTLMKKMWKDTKKRKKADQGSKFNIIFKEKDKNFSIIIISNAYHENVFFKKHIHNMKKLKVNYGYFFIFSKWYFNQRFERVSKG